ncbi:hypothetical protein Fmac_025191 [Flemingia macrophylla]|uniref:Uncharacterized protein n=1 Tax=Flemingia macrophylla TaxID=520843 RepID=A0ABD1LS40_9FABA
MKMSYSRIVFLVLAVTIFHPTAIIEAKMHPRVCSPPFDDCVPRPLLGHAIFVGPLRCTIVLLSRQHDPSHHHSSGLRTRAHRLLLSIPKLPFPPPPSIFLTFIKQWVCFQNKINK